MRTGEGLVDIRIASRGALMILHGWLGGAVELLPEGTDESA